MYESTRHRQIAIRTELNDLRSGRRPSDEPRRTGWAEYRRIELAVAIVIAASYRVAVRSERESEERGILASNDEPFASRRTPDRDIRFSISGEIALHRFVGWIAELHRE